MKLIQIVLLLIAATMLVSCEQLGIEVTTVKGNWKSEITDGKCISLNISPDERYSSTVILNVSTLLANHQGTWVLKNDTLSLYKQDMKGYGVRKLIVEQLGMSTITLRNVKNGNIYIFNRIYTSPKNDYDSHFEEVFDLKKGGWWYAWNTVVIASGLLFIAGSLMALSSIINYIAKLFKNVHKKDK